MKNTIRWYYSVFSNTDSQQQLSLAACPFSILKLFAFLFLLFAAFVWWWHSISVCPFIIWHLIFVVVRVVSCIPHFVCFSLIRSCLMRSSLILPCCCHTFMPLHSHYCCLILHPCPYVPTSNSFYSRAYTSHSSLFVTAFSFHVALSYLISRIAIFIFVPRRPRFVHYSLIGSFLISTFCSRLAENALLFFIFCLWASTLSLARRRLFSRSRLIFSRHLPRRTMDRQTVGVLHIYMLGAA